MTKPKTVGRDTEQRVHSLSQKFPGRSDENNCRDARETSDIRTLHEHACHVSMAVYRNLTVVSVVTFSVDRLPVE